MKKKLFFLLCLALYISNAAYGIWGKTGHRIVAEIANRNLTEKTIKKINIILDGESLPSISTWADEIKSDPEFKKYNSWHYVNIPLDKNYGDVEKNPKGDVVMAINECIEVLKNENSSLSSKAFYLKFLVHLVGDIHQPFHVGRFEDRGGNDIKLKFFGKSTNLHRLWDTDMINDHQMSYTEFAENLEKLKFLNTTLNPKDWAKESQNEVKKIYSEVKKDDYIGYEYLYKNFHTVEKQLYKAGIRLADLLNEVIL
tara:strand:- start:444 stop:1208 length:765 start_codon:yes stop_codon:yes gene_type:complete